MARGDKKIESGSRKTPEINNLEDKEAPSCFIFMRTLTLADWIRI